MTSTWTAAYDATLAKLISEGQSMRLIADAIGRSRNAICGRAHRLKLHFAGKPVKPAKQSKPRQPTKQRDIARFTAAAFRGAWRAGRWRICSG